MQENLDDVLKTEHICGSNGIFQEDAKKYCMVCGRAISVHGTFFIPGTDDGEVSRRLAAYRLDRINELQRLLSPGYSVQATQPKWRDD